MTCGNSTEVNFRSLVEWKSEKKEGGGVRRWGGGGGGEEARIEHLTFVTNIATKILPSPFVTLPRMSECCQQG